MKQMPISAATITAIPPTAPPAIAPIGAFFFGCGVGPGFTEVEVGALVRVVSGVVTEVLIGAGGGVVVAPGKS
jgi:hypothetical protein